MRTVLKAGFTVSAGRFCGRTRQPVAAPPSPTTWCYNPREINGPFDLADVEALWVVAGRMDSRIEPIPCVERQWLEDDESLMIEVARREGRRIALQ